MYLAVITTSTHTLKVIKRNYVTAVGGIALTALALVGAVSLSDTSPNVKPVQSFEPAASSIKPAFPASPVMTYYIVGSEEQLLAVQADAESRVADNAVFSPRNNWKFSILLASTPAETADAMGIVDSAKARWWAAGASGLEVVDLR